MEQTNLTINRPNKMVEARFDLSAKQNDIIDIVLNEIKEDNNNRYTIKIADYLNIIDGDTSNMYRDFKKAAKEFVKNKAGFTLYNYDNQKEVDLFWFSEISYEDKEGKITFEISSKVKELCLQMKSFTKYNLRNPLNLNSKYSKRLYYYLKRFDDTGYRIDKVDELIEKLDCPSSYKKYSLFRQKVLEVAKAEINEKTDIAFDYDTVKKSGKVINIKFLIYKNEEYNVIENIIERKERADSKEDNRQIEITEFLYQEELDEIKKIISLDLTNEEYIKIIKAADGNVNLIKEKYELSKKGKQYNFVGWMLKAIKDDYKNHKKTANNNFDNFPQRDYSKEDMTDLEKKLLSI